MESSTKGRSRHVELDMDQLVELQPGLGRLMPEVGRRYWILYYAAQGGNWELAHYQWRGLQTLFGMGATLRPKMAKHLQSFQASTMQDLERALENRSWPEFERAFHEGIKLANRLHVATNHPEIRWKLPAEPPLDLDVGPAPSDPL
jgi:hypothetical protein